MKRKPPVVKGNDAKRFLLRSELNELKFKLKALGYDDETTQKMKTRIFEIEKELENLFKN